MLLEEMYEDRRIDNRCPEIQNRSSDSVLTHNVFQEVILLKFLLHHQKLLQQQRLRQPRLKRYVRIIFAPQFGHPFAQWIQSFLNSCSNTYSCVLV